MLKLPLPKSNLTEKGGTGMSKVIAAISTPVSSAGLGVIRVSGDGAVAVADKVFRPLCKTLPDTRRRTDTSQIPTV